MGSKHSKQSVPKISLIEALQEAGVEHTKRSWKCCKATLSLSHLFESLYLTKISVGKYYMLSRLGRMMDVPCVTVGVTMDASFLKRRYI